MTVRFFLLPEYQIFIQHSLLVLLLCLCKSFQRTLSFCPRGKFVPESGCKGTTIFRNSKSFSEKVSNFCKVFHLIYKNITDLHGTHYYILPGPEVYGVRSEGKHLCVGVRRVECKVYAASQQVIINTCYYYILYILTGSLTR